MPTQTTRMIAVMIIRKLLFPLIIKQQWLLKEKKDNDHTGEHTVSDENMEVDNSMNSFDYPSTERQKGEASQSTNIEIENETL